MASFSSALDAAHETAPDEDGPPSRNFNPFLAGASIIDCGDVPISPYDNSLALDQMETAYSTLLAREVDTAFTRGAPRVESSPVLNGADRITFALAAAEHGGTKAFALDGKEHPKIVTLGGDHTYVLRSELMLIRQADELLVRIVLPILRSLAKVYGPVAVLHFDAHLGEHLVDRMQIFLQLLTSKLQTPGTEPCTMAP